MSFEIPKSKASLKQNIFEFSIPGDKKKYQLPMQQYINAELRHRLTHVAVIGKKVETGYEPTPDDLVMLAEAQRAVLEEYIPGIYARLDSEQVKALLEAWAEESSVSMGESQASPS